MYMLMLMSMLLELSDLTWITACLLHPAERTERGERNEDERNVGKGVRRAGCIYYASFLSLVFMNVLEQEVLCSGYVHTCTHTHAHTCIHTHTGTQREKL